MVELQRSVSDRATCRASKQKIPKGVWRVGMQAWIAGRNAMTWSLPLPFLQAIKVEYAKNGRGKSKGNGESFEKGELRIGLTAHTKTDWYRPSEVAKELRPILDLEETKTFEIQSIDGFDALESSDQKLIVDALGPNGGKKRKLKTPTKAVMVKELAEDEPTPTGDDGPRIGTRVEVRFETGKWYAGTITKCTRKRQRQGRSDGGNLAGFTIAISYDDGTSESTAFPDKDIRIIEAEAAPVKMEVDSPVKVKKERSKVKKEQVKVKKEKQEQVDQQDEASNASEEEQMVVEPTVSPTNAPEQSESVKEEESEDSEEEEQGLSAYELQRLANIRRNELLMQSLGLNSASASFSRSIGGGSKGQDKKSTRGLKPRKRAKGPRRPSVPTRRSGRISGEKADEVFVVEEQRNGAVILGGGAASELKERSSSDKVSDAASDDRYQSREPEQTLTLESTGGTEQYGEEFFASLVKLSEEAKGKGKGKGNGKAKGKGKKGARAGAGGIDEDEDSPASLSSDAIDYAKRLSKLTGEEEGICKMVPDRIHALAVHPTQSKLIIAAGDRSGNLGLWDADNDLSNDGEGEDEDDENDEDGVLLYQDLHNGAINNLQFHPHDSTKLFTTSYDGTVRCLDIVKQASDLVCTCPGTLTGNRNGHWLQNASLSPDGNVIYLCDSLGYACAYDVRLGGSGSGGGKKKGSRSSSRTSSAASSSSSSEAAAGTAGAGATSGTKPLWRLALHQKKINTIHANPSAALGHYLCTASLDRCVKLWDMRAMRKARSTADEHKIDRWELQAPLAVLPDRLSINSASWGPAGDRIITVGQSSLLNLYHQPHLEPEAAAKQAAAAAAAAASKKPQPTKVAADDEDEDEDEDEEMKEDFQVEPTCKARHDNKTGRYLPVFHASWDPKTDHAFVVGSMSKPRQVEVYTTENNATRRVMSLQGDYMNSVQSRNCFHPSLDIVVCGNASGRVHVFR
eukprot:g1324.t1